MPSPRRPLLLVALALASGCGASGRPSPPAPAFTTTAPTPSLTPTTPPVPTAGSVRGVPPDVDHVPADRHTDAFMIRPHPTITSLDRKDYCVGGVCRGLDAQLAVINRTAKGRAAPGCDDIKERACGARCESVMLGTWSGGKTVTFTEAFGGPITHCYDRGGQLVAAHHNRTSGPNFGDTQECFHSGTPTQALCRPGVLDSSCADGRCLAFATMVAAATASAAHTADHGCGEVVTPVCGGANPPCQSVKAVSCPDYQDIIVQHPLGTYVYSYTGAGGLIATDDNPTIDLARASLPIFGQRPGRTSCPAQARTVCGPG